MTFIDLIVGGLATWQIVEIWHHSSLFANWRARTEMLTGELGELFACPFCLSAWVGFMCAMALWYKHPTEIHGTYSFLRVGFWVAMLGIKTFIYGLAVARLANLGNDLTHHRCRTVRHNNLDPSPTGSDSQKVVFEIKEPDDGSEPVGTTDDADATAEPARTDATTDV